MYDFFEQNKGALYEFARISRDVGGRADYVQGGGGNTSAKLYDGLMAVKASGYKLSDITPNDGYAVIDGKTLRNFYENHCAGDFADVEKECAEFTKGLIIIPAGLKELRPSVEAGFHSVLDRYVIHSHSVYANLLACAKGGEDIAGDALRGADFRRCFVPYTDPGARLTFAVRDALTQNGRPEVIFMQNHGLIVHHNSADEALRIHSKVNELIAQYFGLGDKSFPKIILNDLGGGLYESGTEFIRERLGLYKTDFFTKQPLYPDQMVYLQDSLLFDNGTIRYKANYQKALAMEETVAAVIFITENIERMGLTVSTMDEAARSFIEGWESEKYRKAVLQTPAQ